MTQDAQPIKRYTVTASRAHKIVERLQAAAATYRDQASTSNKVIVRFQSAPTQDQVSALKAETENALSAIAHYIRINDAVGNLRERIGQINAARGVINLMAQVETKRRELKMLTAAIEAFTPDTNTVHVDNIEQFNWAGLHGQYSASSVSVTAVSANEHVEPLVKSKVNLERTIYTLQDQISVHNAGTFEIELPEDIAKTVGL